MAKKHKITLSKIEAAAFEGMRRNTARTSADLAALEQQIEQLAQRRTQLIASANEHTAETLDAIGQAHGVKLPRTPGGITMTKSTERYDSGAKVATLEFEEEAEEKTEPAPAQAAAPSEPAPSAPAPSVVAVDGAGVPTT